MADEGQPEAEKRTAWTRVNSLVDRLWSPLFDGLGMVGSHVQLLGQVVFWGARPPYRPRVFFEAAEFVGVQSLLIAILVSLFVGMVFSLQSVEAFRTFQAESFVSSTVSIALTRELAPVFTAIVIAARAGAGMATELGSMRITEQIDALAALAVNPVQYLVVPRVVATTIMVPLLTMIFNLVGITGAYLVAVVLEGVDRGVFIENMRWYLDPIDIWQGLWKALIFGLAVSIISCHQGFYASGGAKGVGIATTRAVVGSFVCILVLDYFLTDLWFVIFPAGV